MATGYHIVLLFDMNDICLGVSSELLYRLIDGTTAFCRNPQ